MTSYAGEGMIATLHATGDLIDLIYKFNLQAVGYSRSSLPRETRTTHNKTNNNSYTQSTKTTYNTTYSSYVQQKHTLHYKTNQKSESQYCLRPSTNS